MPTRIPRRPLIDRVLGAIERGGNALPHPATLFAILALLVIVALWIGAQLSVAVAHPRTGATVTVFNLLSVEGLHRIMTGLVGNFTGFAPLGTVLVALIGIGVAEHSGLIGAALRRLVLAAPRALLTPILVFAGVMSNMASEIGYVLLVPLGGLIFIAAGRHPILGMVAAIAGVSGGYSANLLIGTIDPLLSGLSEEAARIVDPDYRVTPLANWHFMIVSTPILTLLGFAPELTQAAYRVGDSVTNIISPMMSHFALIIAFFRRYEPQAGIDTLVAVMLPYSVVFLVGWSALFAPWLVLGLPTGPGAAISY